jgi:uncharacterized protein
MHDVKFRAAQSGHPRLSALDVLPNLIAVLSGGLVGFSLGLVGGGGSILAVPLLVYAVGVSQPHVAIGTSAVAVAASALANLIGRIRGGLVKWHCVLLFAAMGVIGALIGAQMGLRTRGEILLSLFALLMLVVGALMLKHRKKAGRDDVTLGRENAPKLAGYGIGAGMLSGFFGIGGGFLIVPGLMAATGMPIANAVASSLVAVTAFGLTTAASYAFNGLVDWLLAGLFVGGAVLGGVLGNRLSHALGLRRGALNIVFALAIFAVASYMLWRSLGPLLA